ncbi:hypothetical protein AJ78_06243 [Emergomyces pasteurianus Ep9510]|uniref:Uncharacterized protein n=1 Tax=Emergomyces pasteurianus Ep9510 TaxID=1447872 RepID=A0A1J9PZG8_9EURO|nr:hypothetical protein AJ78_06243 [Emergomyces pasteurianus Ep9510]
MTNPSKWKFRSVSLPSTSQLPEPENFKRFSLGNRSLFDLSRSRTITTPAAASSIRPSAHFKGDETHASDPALSGIDRLPDDQVKLDGIVNYHLSQLDRLHLELAWHNEAIELLSRTNPPKDMRCLAEKLLERIRRAKDARNLLEPFMKFHVHEVWRILKLKQKVAGNDEKDYPAIPRSLPTDQELRSMFCDDEPYT